MHLVCIIIINLHADVPFTILLLLMQKSCKVCLVNKRHFLKECQDFNILLQNKVLKYFKKEKKQA